MLVNVSRFTKVQNRVADLIKDYLDQIKADLENYSPIRVSLGKYNTKEEIDIFVKTLINVINMIRKRK